MLVMPENATSNKYTLSRRRSLLLSLRRLSFLMILALLANAGCSSIDEGVIPITTSSAKARDYYLQGREYAERLRRVEANKLFKKAIAEDSLFALAHLSLASVQPSARGFFESFARAKELMDSVSEGEKLLILTTDAGIRGDQSAQEENLRKLISIYSKSARAHNLLGQLFFAQQRYQLAIKSFQTAIEISPEFSSPYNQLGYSYRFIGNLEKAAETFKKYAELIPDEPNPHDSYAELLLKKGEFESAIESYRRALALDPGFVASYIGIASSYCYQGLHQQARNELQQLYAVARNDGQRRQALYGIAASFTNEGLSDSARAVIIRAKKMADQIEDIRAVSADYTTLGALALDQNDTRQAQIYFDSAAWLIRTSDADEVTKANTERFHLFATAGVKIVGGELDEADSLSQLYEEQAALITSVVLSGLAHQLKAMIALKRREFSTAISEFSQSNPRDPYNIYRKALAYQGSGDIEKAKTELKNVAEFNSVLGLNYAFARGKAMALLDSLSR